MKKQPLNGGVSKVRRRNLLQRKQHVCWKELESQSQVLSYQTASGITLSDELLRRAPKSRMLKAHRARSARQYLTVPSRNLRKAHEKSVKV